MSAKLEESPSTVVDHREFQAFVSKMTALEKRVDDLESKNQNQKLAFYPLTAISFIETCIAAHLKGCEKVCDVRQASQLGIVILENMLGNPGHMKEIHLHAFLNYYEELTTAKKIVQGLLYFFEEAPISLLTAGINNISMNERNAVAHNGGFIRAMLNIDRQQGVDTHSTETELTAFYNQIQSHVPDSNISLEMAIGSLVEKAVKVNHPDLSPRDERSERDKRTKMLKTILCKVFILPKTSSIFANGWRFFRGNRTTERRIIKVW